MVGTLFLFCAIAIVAISSGEVIETRLGKLDGLTRKSRDGQEYTAWTKVPYAKPPIGSLRLANPEPYGSWTGVLNATVPSPWCLQVQGTSTVGEEDCLYLNIYKPNVEDKMLPVVLYVHGGAFMTGNPGPENQADFLMDEEVILVTITYRLSTLGFIAMNDKVIPGNFGLKDQALALKWVYENIEDYGGDSKRITVFGESAGGASTHLLLLSPLTRDMVFAAHAVSGTVNKVWSVLNGTEAKGVGEGVVATLGCSRATTEEILECLRAIENPASIQLAMPAVGTGKDVDFSSIGFVIEPAEPGAFASEDLSLATSTKPLILSHCAGEFMLPEAVDLLTGGGRAGRIKQNIEGYCRGYLSRFIPDENELQCAVKRFRERYLKNETLPGLLKGSSMSEQDVAFVYPSIQWGKKHQGPIWIYQMVHKGEHNFFSVPNFPENVAPHADDVSYMINRRSTVPGLNPRMNPTDELVSRTLIKHLINLATYGNPTPDGSWEQFRQSEIYRMLTEGFRKGDCDFIKEQREIYHFWNDLIHT